VPTATPEAPDVAGAGDVLFDIYKFSAARDINKDGTDEAIKFTKGASKSKLTINGKAYDVPKAHLAQLFAITDVNKSDKILELVFTEEYDAGLADSEKAFSYLYWWNGTKLVYMGGLMDVKFAGGWRTSFKASAYFNGIGQVTCLTRTEELTDLWYMGHYKPKGTDRKLVEYSYTAKPLGDVTKLTCKKFCLIQTKAVNTYMSSEYDYYWIPTLSPTTDGRIHNPAPGLVIIAQPGEKLTITGVYGKYWVRVKTYDGYQGWIYCKDKKVGAYFFTMGWTAEDMFDGLISAG
jgi:hypothetical protein